MLGYCILFYNINTVRNCDVRRLKFNMFVTGSHWMLGGHFLRVVVSSIRVIGRFMCNCGHLVTNLKMTTMNLSNFFIFLLYQGVSEFTDYLMV